MKKIFILFLAMWSFHMAFSQDRFTVLENKLEQITAQTPGLAETVDFSVVGVSIQEFLRGLAETNNLNISIDPSLDIRVYNNFTNEKVSNILLFLCREYSLDIQFVGSIMSFKKFEAPTPPQPKLVAKKIDIQFDAINKNITLNLQNDSIQRVAKEITSLTGNNLVLSPEIKADKKMSVYIQDMPFENAIQKMAFANGLEMEKTDDDFYVLREVPAEEIAKNTTSSRSGNRFAGGNSSSRNNRQAADGIFTKITDSLGVKYISFDTENTPIADAIKQVSQDLNQNYFLFSEPTGNTTAHLSKVTYDEFLNFILQGSKHTYKAENDIYLIGERSLEGLRKTKVIRLQYRSFQDVMAVIPSELKNGVQISEFKDLNSFILSGSAPQIQEIEAFVYEIDKVVPLVMIEVIMVDINRDHNVTTGIKAGLKDDAPTKSSGTFNDGTNGDDGLKYLLSSATINTLTAPLNLGNVDKRFYLQLSAMESNRNAQIRSMPKLATLNGHEATLSIGTKRNYVIENSNIVGSLTPTTTVTRQVNSAEANLEINITPVVSGDDHVTLNITVSNSDFITEPQNNLPPDTRNSTFTSLIRVRDNDMVLLGGMERINKSEAGSGVPLLSRIPIIKWFFSSRSKSKSKSISVVFIKPSIIY